MAYTWRTVLIHYTVQRGDTLAKIARNHDVDDWRDIVRANPSVIKNGDPRTMQPGNILHIPEPVVVEPPPEPPTPEPPEPPTPEPPPNQPFYGATDTGPDHEPAETTGIIASSLSAVSDASRGEVVLLEGGSYSGSFTIPAGVTVKPYNGEEVRINGTIGMESDSVIAGCTLTSSGGWVVRTSATSTQKTGMVIRNNRISGGNYECVRISKNCHNVLITGNELSSGGNHCIKIHGENSQYAPTATIHNNLVLSPDREDGIQTEDNGPVTISYNTLDGAPENNIDIKDGTVTVKNNLFVSSTQGAIITHINGEGIIHDNHFASGKNIELGSRNNYNPGMDLYDNVIDGGSIWLRRSTKPVVVRNNTMNGGRLKVGFSTSGDYPRNAAVFENTFTGVTLEDNVTKQGGEWDCYDNTLNNVSGDWSHCG